MTAVTEVSLIETVCYLTVVYVNIFPQLILNLNASTQKKKPHRFLFRYRILCFWLAAHSEQLA